jgi:hypothetical protein
LHRLQNGAILDELDPKVWWIQIGAKDIATDHCSSESLGAISMLIVEEIKIRRPHAKIVWNSILPPTSGFLDNDDDDDDAWMSIVKTNQLLECYAESADDVVFFDATNLFLVNEGDDSSSLSIASSLEGDRKWGEAIVEKVLKMTET